MAGFPSDRRRLRRFEILGQAGSCCRPQSQRKRQGGCHRLRLTVGGTCLLMRRILWVILLSLGLGLVLSSAFARQSLEFVAISIGFFLMMLGLASK